MQEFKQNTAALRRAQDNYMADPAVKKQARITSKTKHARAHTHTHTGSHAQTAEPNSIFQCVQDIYKIDHKVGNLKNFLQRRMRRG